MSLTQERIDEIAVECWTYYLANASSCTVADTYNHFLSRIREEQEAVYYLNKHRQVSNSPWPSENTLLFTIPPAATCNCSELVEALQEAYTQVKELCDCHNHPYPLASFERYDETLASHAKRMQSPTDSRGEE